MNSSEQELSAIKHAESQIQVLQSQFSLQCSQFQQSLQSQYSQLRNNLQKSLKEIHSSLEIREKELESKQSKLNSLQKELDDRQKELEWKEKQFNCAEKFVCDRCKTLGFKVSETGNVVVKIEPTIEFEDDDSVSDASIKLFVRMGGKELQMFLNDRVNEHDGFGEEIRSAIKLSSDPAKLVLDAMEGFFRPYLRKGNVEYEGSVVRSSCVILLEQLLELKPEIRKVVKEEARAVARDWFEKVNVEKGNYMGVLGFLLLVVVYEVWSDFDKDVLRSFCDVVQQHRVASELRLKLGFLRKCGMSTMGSQFQKQEPYTTPVKSASTSISTDHSSIDLSTLCKEISAKGLMSYLMENEKDLKLIDDKVLDRLRGASDAAQLAFDVVQEFYLEVGEFQGETYISCSNFVLEQLMKLSPHINLKLKKELINFAARWRARLATERTRPFLVFGFLKFLAAYKLLSSFQENEILSLFTIFYDRDDIYEPEQNPKLCRALGLESKIPDLIRSLIKENKQLAAVHYICAFNLVDEFPPGPLLKEYLACTEAAALTTCTNLNNTVKALNECADKQIRALQSAIRCICDYKLFSELSPIHLQQCIGQLEKEIKERKSSKLDQENTGTKKRSADQTTPQSDLTGMKKQAVAPQNFPQFIGPRYLWRLYYG